MTRTPTRLLDVEAAYQEQAMWCWAACTGMVVGYLRRPDDLARCRERGFIGALGAPLPSQGELANLRRGRDGKPHIDCSAPPPAEATEAEEDEWYRVCNWGGWPAFMEFSDIAQDTRWGSRRYALEKSGIEAAEGGPRIRPKLGRPLTAEELYFLVRRGSAAFRQALNDAEDCALSWKMLKRQLDDDSPVIFSWRYQTPGSGHMMVAAGYVSTPPMARGKRPPTRAENWIVALDPLPPLSGDALLIPYHYYLSGPYGRHWRDFWIPKIECGAPYPATSGDAFTVEGGELAASPGAYPIEPAPGEWNIDLIGDRQGLIGTDYRLLLNRATEEARDEAEQGLYALQAMVEGRDSREVAAALFMGATFLKILTRRAAGALGQALSGTAGDAAGLLPGPAVDPALLLGPRREKLTFFSDDDGPLAVPVFEISRQALLDWNPETGERAPRLDAPTELIWPVRWPGQFPFEFFSTVTVRQESELPWRVTSMGRASLVMALATNRWVDRVASGAADASASEDRLGAVVGFLARLVLNDGGEARRLTVSRVLDLLVGLDLLGPIWQAASPAVAPMGLSAALAQDDPARRADWKRTIDALVAQLPDKKDAAAVRELVAKALRRARPIARELEANAESPEPPAEAVLEDLRRLAEVLDRLLDHFRPDEPPAKADTVQRDHLPLFLIEIKELYQLFAAYLVDPDGREFRIEQVYGREFFARPHRVDPQDRVALLQKLRELARSSPDLPAGPAGG